MIKEPRAWTPHPLGQEGAFWTPFRITFWQKKPQKSIFKVYFVTCSWKLQTINTYQHTFWSFLRPWRPKTAKNNQNMGPTCDSVAHQSAGRLKLAPPQPWSRAIPIITNFKNYAPPPNKKGGLQNLYAFRQIELFPNIRRAGSQINQIIWRSIYKLTKRRSIATRNISTHNIPRN